jgi:uncharacterized protein with HEPN domain
MTHDEFINRMKQAIKERDMKKEYDQMIELRDKVADVLEGHDLNVVIPMLMSLLIPSALESTEDMQKGAEKLSKYFQGALMEYIRCNQKDKDTPTH